MDMTEVLPGDCISNIISFTSPRDACRSSSVSSVFKAAKESDDVWERFLPQDYEDIIARSSSSSLSSLTKEQIFFHLCDHPFLLDNGETSFALDKESGKKCYMVSAKQLTIVWSDTPAYWKWISLPESRFPKVARLNYVWWLEITGRIGINLLSPITTYTIFLIYKLDTDHYFTNRHVELSVKREESVNGSHKRVLLDPAGHGAKKREDGWMEVEMGEFFNEQGDDGFIEFRLWETNGYIKQGLLVEGVEFRPRRWG